MNRSRDRQSLWRTGVGQIVGLLLYVGVVELAVRFLTPTPTGLMLLGMGVVMALIPAVLWMSFFYVQDREEQEPRHFVLTVAVLAALLGAAI
jgi:RsiW-degrading membrane proteinase PrsW (M82 family)